MKLYLIVTTCAALALSSAAHAGVAAATSNPANFTNANFVLVAASATAAPQERKVAAAAQQATPEQVSRAVFEASKRKEFYLSATAGDVEVITRLLQESGLKRPIKIIVPQPSDTLGYTGPNCVWVPIWVWNPWPTSGSYQLWRVCEPSLHGYQTD